MTNRDDILRMFRPCSAWLAESGHLRAALDAARLRFSAGAPVVAEKQGDVSALAPRIVERASKAGVAPVRVAVVPVSGLLTKDESYWFGGTGTVRLREDLMRIGADKSIDAILLVVDSPGGQVAGTKELADAVRSIDKIKPVYAYIEDLGASAAYWVASHARAVWCNELAEVGSIGCVAVVYDDSKYYTDLGVVAHVIGSGEMKGAFTVGAPITEEMLADLQARVDEFAGVFIDSVASARRMKRAAVESVADGRVYSATVAQKAGLVDEIMPSVGRALELISGEIAAVQTRKRASAVVSRFEALCRDTGLTA